MNRPVYKFWLVNMGWYSPKGTADFNKVKDICKSIGFEVRVDMVVDGQTQVVGSYSPLYGFQMR